MLPSKIITSLGDYMSLFVFSQFQASGCHPEINDVLVVQLVEDSEKAVYLSEGSPFTTP